MSQSLVRLATPSDRDAVVDVIVTAFTGDPAFLWIFGDQPTFDRLAPAFVGLMFDLRVGRGTVWVTDDCDAVALWSPPHGTRPAPEQIEIPDLGPAEARLDLYQEQVHSVVPAEPHWYLSVLASHPRRRGEGLARVVAAAGLAEARADGMKAYLETVTDGNVALYRRAGWNVYAEVPDVGGLHVRIMEFDATA